MSQVRYGTCLLTTSLIRAIQDICPGNLLAATPREASVDGARVTAGKVYIIDFDRSLRLAHGPGTQPAVLLPPAQFAPPNAGVTHLDPYAWDVYCAGRVLETFLKACHHVRCQNSTSLLTYILEFKQTRLGEGDGTSAPCPWVAEWLVSWLKGEERGCAGVCYCRPTARRALQAVSVIRWCLCAVGWCGNAVEFMKDLLVPCFGFRRS